jgi:predicted ATP-dependent endonuclease of OLD family
MKIQVKNLGPLKEAEFEVADLTIICGGNNTGKTYATYALFGFLHTWREIVSIDIDPTIIKSLINGETVSANLENYINKCQTIVDDNCKKYSEQLFRLFSAPPKSFKNVEFKAIINTENIRHLTKKLSGEYINRVPGTSESLLINKVFNEFNIQITWRSSSKPSEISTDFLSSLVSNQIGHLLFKRVIPSVFIASVERTGISIFRREIDASRNILLENMSRENSPDMQLNIFRARYKTYPLSIQFGLDFNRSIGGRDNDGGFLVEEHPSILEDFGDILGGVYKFSDYDELYYSPKTSPKMRLSVYESSSAVRSLLDLGFYLRNIAEPGSLLIIDEPELNLHPENQRRIARLLARLVNIGIKVFITTHSDYIIKELNTLIMLNHDKPHLKKIAEEEGYKPEELIAAERIKVYIAENSTLVPANIDPEMGIEARSFDTTIEDMNRIQEAIVWGEE